MVRLDGRPHCPHCQVELVPAKYPETRANITNKWVCSKCSYAESAIGRERLFEPEVTTDGYEGKDTNKWLHL